PYTRLPAPAEIKIGADAAYVHMTSNNTIFGTQWHALPDAKGRPLVSDMSSDILCRPLDVSKHALIYAGAQKNLGPSGLTVVVLDKEWLKSARQD
ncbi:3-phosphoserine/phosphohydroxythreonine transaminase, partial [Pseudomonas sp. GW456-12-10-14-LB2]|uniref:aminotransferase class V-fold PLP-dependent enzyme n=1 Tax=Pseudomonas sp. GW456-12-10-14-LB2 TaxID=2070674 RepID=UPI000CBF82A4